MKIRIGNDIKIKWIILQDGVPYDLTGRNIRVELLDATRRKVLIEYTTDKNIINIIFRGKDQYETGQYTVLLSENFGTNNMITLDYVKAFELVRHSYQSDLTNTIPNCMIEVPSFISNIQMGGEGGVGPQGPKGDKGDKGEQGPVGPQGPQGEVGPQGEQGLTGAAGAPGEQGPAGHTPVITIGDNGNWFVDGVDTNNTSKGQNGQNGERGLQGEQGPQGEVGPQGPAPKEWVGTQSQYEALSSKDPETRYYIIEG